MAQIYQLIIIGAGPAGLSAAVYGNRYRLNFLIIGDKPGGTVPEGHLIDNYLGFKSIKGPELAKKFVAHSPTEIIKESVKSIRQNNKNFEVLTDKNQYQSQSLILGLGMKARKLGFKNEDEFLNKGIYYCLPADLDSLKNKISAVVGGGDSALITALKIPEGAKKVYLIHRRDEFRGAPALVDEIKKKGNIELVLSAQITEAKGREKLESIILDNGKELKISQLFIEVGGIPNVYLYGELGLKMENNFIVVDKNQATNIPGVFAAGDITNNPLKQIITAAAEGAIAATSAYNYLKNI
jgi:thioredoxin reductase (NADPH)